MSFTANTAFEARITNNDRDNLANIAGLYQASNVNADCDAGRLVKRGARTDCQGFTSVKNENAFIMTDAAACTLDDVLYACNPYDTKLIGDGRNNYFIGSETLGLGVPAGRYGNFTRIDFDGQREYRFGAGCFASTPTVGKFATVENGKLKPAANAPTTEGSVYFEIVATGNFVEGNSASFAYYDVVGKKVSFTAAAS